MSLDDSNHQKQGSENEVEESDNTVDKGSAERDVHVKKEDIADNDEDTAYTVTDAAVKGVNGEENDICGHDTKDASEEELLMLLDCVSFHDISSALSNIHEDLPLEVIRHTASFLTVKYIDVNEVTAVRASSTRGDYPLSSVLGRDDGTWWISAEGSMENGRGEEYIEFSLSPNGAARRCSFVGVSIPPLPQGPLSVRRFRIDWSYDGTTWTNGCATYNMKTMDMAGMQPFKLEKPIDAACVRLVCLMTAFASEQERRGHGGPSPFDCVGLFHVRWK